MCMVTVTQLDLHCHYPAHSIDLLFQLHREAHTHASTRISRIMSRACNLSWAAPPPVTCGRMASELSSSKASYAESLDQLQYATYRDKLALIEGLDPYTVPSEAIVHDVEALPKITHRDIFNYLIFSPSPFTIDDMKDCQSLEAYNVFFRGWVRDVGVTQIKEDTCVVRALVGIVRVHDLNCDLCLLVNIPTWDS